MALPTLADIRTEARDAMLDTDSANYGLSTVELDRRINAAYMAVKALQDNHPRMLSATQCGSTVAGGTYEKELTITTIRRLLAVYVGSSNADRVPEAAALEYVEPWEIRLMRAETTLALEPQQWSAFQHGTHNTGGTPGSWWLMVHPAPSGDTHFMIEALVFPEALVNATDTPDVDDVSAYAIAWIAAAAGAFMLGRPPEFVQQILSRVPDSLQSAYTNMQRTLGVNRDAERA